MLYLIATPIGNLQDITYRAIAALSECDLILCENPKHSSILLREYKIKAPTYPFHQHNEKKTEEIVLEKLEARQKVALISDAGTPLISDPGKALVQACIEKKIPFTSLPGPCSPIVALTLSGLDASCFQFIGFLPKPLQKHNLTLKKALYYPGTTICFESPQRVVKTLQVLEKLDPTRELALCRELTKVFEECLRGTAADLLTHFSKKPPKGEMVLLISEGKPPETELELDQLLEILQQEHGLSKKEALKMAAKLLDKPKNYLYQKHLLKT